MNLIGGMIAGEHNLSHDGDCWVGEEAKPRLSTMLWCVAGHSYWTMHKSTVSICD